MKRWIVLFLVVFGLSISTTAHAIEANSYTFTLGGQQKKVTFVKFNANEDLELRPAMAMDTVGKVDTLANIAKDNNALAAITATYFNAYNSNDLQPMGAVMIDRVTQHIRGGSVSMGITATNDLVFGSGDGINIKGAINGQVDSAHSFSAWFINHIPTSQDEVVVFTPTFRQSTLNIPGFKFVLVNEGVVANVMANEATIPPNGFVIAYGSNAYGAEKFNIGDTVEYWVEYPGLIGSDALHMVSVGPKLVTGGKYAVDVSDFKETKITKAKSKRTFIGIMKDKTIVLGTVDDITIQDLAAVLINMGMVEAMNLDGGVSQGLYYNGKYLTTPGRKISNALIVVKREKYPRVEVNGGEIFFPDAKPFIDSGNRTLVPIRFIAEKYGANVEYNNVSQQVTITMNDKTITLTINKNTADVNGRVITLDTKSIIKDSRTYVPLRFITEALGGDVDWDQGRYMVVIKNAVIVTAETHYKEGLKLLEEGKKEAALEKFNTALLQNPKLIYIWTKIGEIYESQNDIDKTIDAYKRSNDDNIQLKLGKLAFEKNKYDIAISAFQRATWKLETQAEGHYYLALIYMKDESKNNNLALMHLQRVIDLHQDEKIVKEAMEHIVKVNLEVLNIKETEDLAQ